MTKTCTVVTAALIALTGTAHAQELSYDYIELGYNQIELDDFDVDVDGFGLNGSWAVTEDVFIFGNYARGETDTVVVPFFDASGKLKLESFGVGFGWRHSLQERTDLNLSAAFERARLRGKGDFDFFGSESENGYSLSVALRHLIAPKLEVNGAITYADIIDDDTVFSVGVLGHLNRNFSVGGTYSVGSDAKAWGLLLRVSL